MYATYYLIHFHIVVDLMLSIWRPQIRNVPVENTCQEKDILLFNNIVVFICELTLVLYLWLFIINVRVHML